MTKAEIIQIVISTLSLLATIAVSFLIYWLQRRHEKEIERIENNRRQKELEEEAHKFLSENCRQRDYLPWCIVAANLHRHENHKREIYNKFCRCSVDLQTEILRQEGFKMSTIEGCEWVDFCFKKLDEDIKKYKLGRNYLYDGAKYFHRGFSMYRDYLYKLKDTDAKVVIYNKSFTQAKFIDVKRIIDKYIDEHFIRVFGEDKEKNQEEESVPPFDYMWESLGLAETEEYIVCYWMMEFVFQVATNVYNRFENALEGIMFEDSTDAQVVYFEDKYYQTLLWLYYTYYEPYIKEKEEKSFKKNKRG